MHVSTLLKVVIKWLYQVIRVPSSSISSIASGDAAFARQERAKRVVQRIMADAANEACLGQDRVQTGQRPCGWNAVPESSKANRPVEMLQQEEMAVLKAFQHKCKTLAEILQVAVCWFGLMLLDHIF